MGSDSVFVRQNQSTETSPLVASPEPSVGLVVGHLLDIIVNISSWPRALGAHVMTLLSGAHRRRVGGELCSRVRVHGLGIVQHAQDGSRALAQQALCRG